MPAYTTTNQRITDARQRATTSRADAIQKIMASKQGALDMRNQLRQNRLAAPMPRQGTATTNLVGPRPTQLAASPIAPTSGGTSTSQSPATTNMTQSTGGFSPTGNQAAAFVPSAAPGSDGSYPNTGNALTNDPAGTTPVTGWANQFYTGLGLGEAMRDPATIIANLIGGANPMATPLFGMMEPLADDINALLMLSKYGAGGSPAGGRTASDDVNWMANVFGGLMQPNGWQVDVQELLGNLFGAGASGNPLADFLHVGGDANQQVRNALSMLAAVGDSGMNPLVAQAMLSAAQNQALNFQRQVQGGTTNLPFTQYLQNNMGGSIFGG